MLHENKTNQERLGAIGEKIVAEVLNGVVSENKYDMEKDIILNDGTRVEVKTQVRYKHHNAFTIDTKYSNQIKKCTTVDRLIFVEYGRYGHIRLYECIDRNYSIIQVYSKKMAAFPIDKMIKIYDKKHSKIANDMCNLSKSIEYGLNDLYLYKG